MFMVATSNIGALLLSDIDYSRVLLLFNSIATKRRNKGMDGMLEGWMAETGECLLRGKRPG